MFNDHQSQLVYLRLLRKLSLITGVNGLSNPFMPNVAFTQQQQKYANLSKTLINYGQ